MALPWVNTAMRAGSAFDDLLIGRHDPLAKCRRVAAEKAHRGSDELVPTLGFLERAASAPTGTDAGVAVYLRQALEGLYREAEQPRQRCRGVQRALLRAGDDPVDALALPRFSLCARRSAWRRPSTCSGGSSG